MMIDFELIKSVIFKTVDFKDDIDIVFDDFDGVKVKYDREKACIGANSKSGFARGCFLLAMNITEGKDNFEIIEKAHIKSCGAMIDCSRNAVMKVESVKRYINCMAALGLNFLMLYTEDTYEIPNRPRFGYLRGRYTIEEIREMVEYGEKFGVELVPCIQTLGHMEQYLRWAQPATKEDKAEHISAMKDTPSVLLCDYEETYRFIEDAIKACRSAFKTNRIHIGMDEAHDIGLGRYLDINGFKNRYNILKKHLGRVVEICKKYDFEPMMWSDMFFRLGSPTGAYYDKEFNFPEGVTETIPDVDMVYWDYYGFEKERYDTMIERHKILDKKIVFAGGLGTWAGFLVEHDPTLNCSIPALKSCIENGVDTVMATLWGDDGQEANHFLSMPYLPIYSEYCYKGLDCSMEDIKRASEFLTKIKFDDVEKMSNLTFRINGDRLIQGKRLFYGDILYDMTIDEDSCDTVIELFNGYAERMRELMEESDKNYECYSYVNLVYTICSIKAELRKNLRKSYKAGDKDYLVKVMVEILPELLNLYSEFSKLHSKQWKDTYKPFGYEVLSFRYGGVMARVHDAIDVIAEYLDGKIDKIEELEEEILDNEGCTMGMTAKRLVTPSCLF